MATVAERPAASEETGWLFEGVSRDDYEAMLRIVGDRPIRVTYDRGRMQVMSPRGALGNPSFLLGAMVTVLAEELELPHEPADPVTFRRKDLEKGGRARQVLSLR